MTLQRYDTAHPDAQRPIPDYDGEYVKLEDVLVLLKELSEKLDDPDVLFELEDNDLNGSILVDEYISDIEKG